MSWRVRQACRLPLEAAEPTTFEGFCGALAAEVLAIEGHLKRYERLRHSCRQRFGREPETPELAADLLGERAPVES